MSDSALPLNGRGVPGVLVALAALCCGAAAALTAVGVASHSTLLVLLPVALCAGIIVALIALTRFAVFVLLMLLVRASVDAGNLSSSDAAAQLLTPSTIIGVLFIVAAALWLVAAYRQQGRLPGSGLRTALVVLVWASLVSVPNAVDPKESLSDVLRLLAIVLMYTVLEQLMADPKMMRRALVAVFCSAIFPILYTAAGFLMGNPPVEVKEGVTRVVGTFVQSNAFGAYLMLLIIVGAALFPHVHGRVRTGLLVLLIVCGVCLVLTYTIAALLGTLLGLVVVAMRQSKRLLLAIAATLVLAVSLAPTLTERLGAVTNASTYAGSIHGGNSLAWRISYWSQIVHLADRNPATGIGYGMTAYLTAQGKQPHNDYLRAYVETGLIGLAVYLVVIVLLVGLGLRAVRVAPPGSLDRGVAVGYLGCAVAMATTSLGSNEINGVAQLWYFVAFAAAASAVVRRASAHRDAEAAEARDQSYAGPAP